MENIGYQSPFAADAHGYEEPEETMEKMMRALYGGLDSEEMEDLRARREQRKREERDHAVKAAQAILRKAGRTVGRKEMLSAMNLAVSSRVYTFLHKPDEYNASMLLATVFCKNILADGPLHD